MLSRNGGLCKLLLCFLNKPCEISRHGGSGETWKMLKLGPPERFDFFKPLDQSCVVVNAYAALCHLETWDYGKQISALRRLQGLDCNAI